MQMADFKITTGQRRLVAFVLPNRDRLILQLLGVAIFGSHQLFWYYHVDILEILAT